MNVTAADPHFIEGFVKECYDLGLTADQASALYDAEIKLALTEDPDYAGAVKEGLEKAAAGGLRAVLGGLKRSLPGKKGIGDILGASALIGAGGHATGVIDEDNAAWAYPLIGLGVGAASMMRRPGRSFGQILRQGANTGSFKAPAKAVAKATNQPFLPGMSPPVAAPPKSYLGQLQDSWGKFRAAGKNVPAGQRRTFGKAMQDMKDTGLRQALRPLGVGTAAGVGAIGAGGALRYGGDAANAIKKRWAENVMDQQGIAHGGASGAGPTDFRPGWAVGEEGGSAEEPMSFLLPGHTQEALRSGASSGGPRIGPYSDIRRSGDALKELEAKMQENQALIGTDIGLAERSRLLEENREIAFRRDRELKNLERSFGEVDEAERKMRERHTQALMDAQRRQSTLEGRLGDMAGGESNALDLLAKIRRLDPSDNRYAEDLEKLTSGVGSARPSSFFGLLRPHKGSPEERRAQLDKILRELTGARQRSYELERWQDPGSLVTPEMEALADRYGING